MVDPSALTPPYDRSLASALAARGVEVELLTSRFLHGEAPDVPGCQVTESFYRRSGARGGSAPLRLPFKAIEHLGDLARFSKTVGTDQDLVHYQWLTAPGFDRHFLPDFRPRVMTAHHLPEGGRAFKGMVGLLSGMDRTIALTESARDRLVAGGLDPDRVAVIPHGAFDYLTRVEPLPLPPPLAATAPNRPVVLFFGLIRANKGLDLLVEAMAQVPEAELWIVGKSKLPERELKSLTARAESLPGGSRLVTRFVAEGEIRSVMERADVLVLPYRSRDESGVLYAGLAFGKAMVVTDLGGPGELAEKTDAVVAVPPEDPAALALAIRDLVEHTDNREELERRATALADSELSWDRVAEQTIAVYEEAIGETRR